jgi:D-sedoheptulose 7-phosphate isomerase
MTENLTTSALGADVRQAATVKARIAENIAATQGMLRGPIPRLLAAVAELVTDALRAGNKVLLFGNGGSAADATHLAAEMVGRFRLDRPALPALSLTDNGSSMSAIANDFGFQEVFARQVAAIGVPGDVAIGITTSGRSANVVEGLKAARDADLRTVALCGVLTRELERVAEFYLCTPMRETARIQECHMLLGHILCELVERALFPEST